MKFNIIIPILLVLFQKRYFFSINLIFHYRNISNRYHQYQKKDIYFKIIYQYKTF